MTLSTPLDEERETGRTLDAKIAEKVMGWRRVLGSYCGSTEWHHTAVILVPPPMPNSIEKPPRYTDQPITYFETVPRYTKSIDLASDVVEAMRDRGFDFSLRNFGTYTMDFVARDLSGTWSSDGETAPLAICLAALKALEASRVYVCAAFCNREFPSGLRCTRPKGHDPLLPCHAFTTEER